MAQNVRFQLSASREQEMQPSDLQVLRERGHEAKRQNRKSCNSNPRSSPVRAHQSGTGPGELLSCGLALSLLVTDNLLSPPPLFFQLTIPFI